MLGSIHFMWDLQTVWPKWFTYEPSIISPGFVLPPTKCAVSVFTGSEFCCQIILCLLQPTTMFSDRCSSSLLIFYKFIEFYHLFFSSSSMTFMLFIPVINPFYVPWPTSSTWHIRSLHTLVSGTPHSPFNFYLISHYSSFSFANSSSLLPSYHMVSLQSDPFVFPVFMLISMVISWLNKTYIPVSYLQPRPLFWTLDLHSPVQQPLASCSHFLLKM